MFSPISLKVKFKYGTSGWTWHGHSICITKPVMVSETYYVDVCDGGDDKYRFGFGNHEKLNEVSGIGNTLDFGARMYSSRVGRFLSLDPEARSYPSHSPYHFVRNNPILRIDPTGRWDVTVHAFSDRTKYGYGIAIVTDRHGKEVMRFKVRLEGTGGTDRMQTNANTPLGIYDIPEAGTWISGGSRQSYGPNHRLALNGESGEIAESGRSEIRIHGGRQENYNAKAKTWTPVANPVLKKTHGCMRCYDNDILNMKNVTDRLEANDPQETPGKLEIKDDLVEYKGKYYTPDDYDYLQKEEQTLNQVKRLNAGEGGNSREVQKQEKNVKSAQSTGIN